MISTRFLSGALSFVLCWGGSVAVGYMLFGASIFDRHLALFQFVATGAVAAFTVAGLKADIARWMPVAFVVGFVLITLTAGSVSAARLFRDAMLVLSVVAAVSTGVRMDLWFPRLSLGKCILWAALFGALQLAAVIVIAIVSRLEASLGTLLLVARIGTLVGAGVGIGYEVSSLVVGRIGRSDLKAA